MAWSDEPTEAQLNTVALWLKYETKVSPETITSACNWLEEHGTRGDVAREMTRLKQLKDEHRLDEKNCFTGEIWEGFEP